MNAAPSDERRPILRRRSAVLLVLGVGAFAMFDPPAEDARALPGGTILTRRYTPPVVAGGEVQLGPATRISRGP